MSYIRAQQTEWTGAQQTEFGLKVLWNCTYWAEIAYVLGAAPSYQPYSVGFPLPNLDPRENKGENIRVGREVIKRKNTPVIKRKN